MRLTSQILKDYFSKPLGIVPLGRKVFQEDGRSGAGWIPLSLSTLPIVLGATLCPSCLSSPWIRQYPQPEFSRAIRTIKAAILFMSPGRPTLLASQVHLSAIRRRCHLMTCLDDRQLPGSSGMIMS